jgi:hypothetical protein
MNFPFKSFRGIVIPLPQRKSAHRLKSIWTRDPRTGRLVQTWCEDDDGERSCTARPNGPRIPPRRDQPKRAA